MNKPEFSLQYEIFEEQSVIRLSLDGSRITQFHRIFWNYFHCGYFEDRTKMNKTRTR